MRKLVESIAAALFLAMMAGISGAALIGAALTGAIDGPGRGFATVSLASNPIGFWLMVVFYLVVCIASLAGALHFIKGRDAA